MKWRVAIARTAEKELTRLSTENQRRVAKSIRLLEEDPFPQASKRLKGREEFRIRAGDYRVLYIVDHESRSVRIVAVGHRREVYR
jgi:mRNA interferase RelE/StbE